MDDIWARVDEALDTDPLQLRGIVAEVLQCVEQTEAALVRVRVLCERAQAVPGEGSRR